ncbi:Condensation domain-containing protein [Elsinoe fawcettii]|nr:Condensation domain-containing protein [Elsinoe fawcettii]
MTDHDPKRVFRYDPPRVQELDCVDVDTAIYTPFDLAKDELIRVIAAGNELLIVTTHALADLNRIQVLLSEACRCYSNQDATPATRFDYLSSPSWTLRVTLEEREFWSRRLRDATDHLALGDTYSSSKFEGSSRVRIYEGPIIASLNQLAGTKGMTRHQLVATAAAQTLQWMYDVSDVVLGMPYQNRNAESEQTSLGLHLDRLPLRIRSTLDDTCAEMLDQTRHASQEALANAIPFHEIMLALGKSPTLEYHPIFQVMVTFHLEKAIDKCFDVPGIECERNHVYPQGSKFAIMFEWTELGAEKWMLRIEYDSTGISLSMIEGLERALVVVLSRFVAEKTRKEMFEELDRDEKLGAAKCTQRSPLSLVTEMS